MKIDKVFECKTPLHILQEFFDSHKTKVFTSSEVVAALGKQKHMWLHNVSSYLSRFPNTAISKGRRVYGCNQALTAFLKDTKKQDNLRPKNYWVHQVLLKHPSEVFRPLDILTVIRKEFGRNVTVFALRAALAEHDSICIGAKAGKGFYGTPKALEKLKKELEKRGTQYTVVYRGG